MAVTTATQPVGTIYNPKTGESKATDPNKDRDNFLLLLTTQLKNQDPTNPTDTNAVTEQIALLSQVEQQTKSNSYLERLVNMFSKSQSGDAVNYIGRQVEATGNQAELKNGKTTFSYSLPTTAEKATINVYDSSKKLVYSGPATTVAGRNSVTWDGVNSATGKQMPDGAYTFEITAKDASSKEIVATTYTTGTVYAIETKEGVNTLSLGSFSIPIDSVLLVHKPSTIDAVSYIGRQVDALGNKSNLAAGRAEFIYNLPAGAAKATVNIYDADKKLVYSGDGTTLAGRNKVIWDGSKTDGTQMKDGTYTFEVVATDATNKDVKVVTYTTGTVYAVETTNGVNSLSLGNFNIPIDSVISVYNPTIVQAS